MRILIQGGTAVLPEGPVWADILVEDGKIVRVGPQIQAEGEEIVDAGGCLVLPGMIDTHTHLDLPVSGTRTADDFATGTEAAILGGTTTVLDFATQDKGATLRQAYGVWRARMDGNASCDVGFHMAVTDWNEQTSRELDDMAELGITSYKFYLAYPALMVEDDAIYSALCRMREIGGIAGFHCENGRLVTELSREQLRRGNTGPAGHPLSRPPEVEAEAIARLLRIAHLADAPVNIVHLSSRLGLEAIQHERVPGQVVHVETCPQYLLLDDSLYAREDGAKYVCSPPMRKRADQEALWGALRDGTIGTIGTDHCPFDYEPQKRAGAHDFTKIPNGLPGIEHRLALMMTEGVERGRISLNDLARLLSENPAKLFGLYPKKGVLAAGSDADIVLWDPAVEWTITAREQHQNVDYTPFEGFPVQGAVRGVWLRGEQIVSDGTLLQKGAGHYLPRETFFA